jgi:phage shock protein E
MENDCLFATYQKWRLKIMDRSNVMKLSCAVAFLLLLPQVLYSKDSDALEFTKDSLAEVRKNVGEGKAILVDVRDLVEWNAGHVRGAAHLPWRDLQGKKSDQLLEKLPKDKIIYTYCAVGYRSSRAGKIIMKHKFDVRPLKPGFEDLVKAGFEPEKK